MMPPSTARSSIQGRPPLGWEPWWQQRRDGRPHLIGDELLGHGSDDPVGAVRVWEELAGWYTAKAGVDNSTLLQPTSEAPYALVNYVRLPHGATRFLLAQLSRPSFHTFVRRRLRDHGMFALPVLCKPA